MSALPDANRRPSGLKHTEYTETPCPSSVLTHAPVSASHSRTVLSQLPDATRRPSGLQHTDFTQLPCPSSVLTHAPVSTSHSRTAVSYTHLTLPTKA